MARQELPVTAYALLGLLTFGDELTGYELKQRADMTLRFYWVSPAMSQVYSELHRLAGAGFVAPLGAGRGRRYRITRSGRSALTSWMHEESPGFPVLKHPVALRLLIGHVGRREETITMLEEYVARLDAQTEDLQEVRDSLAGADGLDQAFGHPALVADWGLAYYASERAITSSMIERLRAG